MESQSSQQSHWLAQTKLQRPRLREDIVPRQRLIELLHESIASHRLTLISAPAGYGKTTLATSLAQIDADLTFTWLALDEDDNDPVVFLMGVIAALQQLNPACGSALLPLLGNQATPNLDARRVMGMLINEIIKTLSQPFVLVLDDLHLVDNETLLLALDYLLDRLPDQMRLLATTRIDPPISLARLRARGQLAELGPPELRFTLAEMDELLNGQLALDLSHQDLRTIQTSTEGWIAGLRLLSSTLAQLPVTTQRTSLITRKMQANRHVFDLMAEEVLDRQPPVLREFLLETAILSELTGELCQAVTLRADAADLLEELYRRNLFVVAIDNVVVDDPVGDQSVVNDASVGNALSFHGPSYRYHALFVEFLRRQLAREQPDQLRKLHRRAAQAHTVPAQVIAHSIAAEEWETAAQTIEQYAESMFSQGLLDKLQGWIQSVPDSIRMSHPWLLYFLGVCLWGRGQFRETQRLLEEALSGFEAKGDDVGRGETMVQLSVVHQIQGDFAPVAPLIQQALTCPISPTSRVQLHISLAYLGLHLADLEQAETNLSTALTLAEASDDPGVLQTLAMQIRSPFLCLPDSIAYFERVCRLIEHRVPDQVSPLRANVDGIKILIYFWRGQIDDAIQSGERAWTTSRQLGGLPWLTVDFGHLLLLLYVLRKESNKADQARNQFAPLLDTYAAWRVIMLYYCCLADWNQNQLQLMRRRYGQMQTSGAAYEWLAGPVLRAMVKGLLEIAEQDYVNAEETLRRASDLQAEIPVSQNFGSARLLLAYLYACLDQPAAALQELTPVLAHHWERETPGLLLVAGPALIPLFQLAVSHNVHAEFAGHLIAMLTHEKSPEPLFVAETGETLTPREVEVLCLLATGASNRTIATELVVSIPTVKTHVSRILGKLDVESRSAAAARARDLRLV